MEGIQYVPLFDYFEEERRADGCYKVLLGKFVTSDTGTGIVHIAPAYGEEDYNISVENGIIRPDNPLNPLDDNGFFLDSVPDFKGQYIKDADDNICENLKARGRLLSKSTN